MSRKLRSLTIVAALTGLSAVALSVPAQARPSSLIEIALSWIESWPGMRSFPSSFDGVLTHPVSPSTDVLCEGKPSGKVSCRPPGPDVVVTNGGCGIDPYGQPRCEQ